MREGHIPKDKRKKILLLSDDLRVHSGIGTMSKEIVWGTCHVFNWFQVGAALGHPEAGRIVDLSEETSKHIDVADPDIKVLPYNGYGDPGLVRWIMEKEKPDAIMIFTDPRYWIWLFQMEHELRQEVPIFYYSIWDSTPFPKYNRPYYLSCDALFGISKQSHNIHKQVVGEEHCTLLSYETVQAVE